MIVHYFLYTLLILLMSIPQSYGFDDKHIELRIKETITSLTSPIIIKKEGLTSALFSCILYEYKKGNHKIAYSYRATKSGIRLVTSMEGDAPPIKELKPASNQPEFGYVYDEKTICMYFNYLNPHSQRTFTCLCHTALAPNEISHFFKTRRSK